MFHPPGGEDVYEGVKNDVDAWPFRPHGFPALTPLLAIAAYLLLDGVEGRAATVRRAIGPRIGWAGSFVDVVTRA